MDFKQKITKLEEFAGVLFIILTGFVTAALFKIANRMTFPNLDELLWHTRSRIFWDKITDFDFSGLIQSAQPGITVYWFTGFMMKFISFDFDYVSYLIAKAVEAGNDFNGVINSNDKAIYALYENASFLFNLPLIALTTVFFITFYYLLRKIGFSGIICAFALFFLASNLFLVFWTTPSDKMLNIFMTLSLLCFLVYMKERFQNNKKKYLYFSAVFGALAVLSKISALFLLPFYFLTYAYYLWPLDRKRIAVILKDSGTWLIIFSFVSVIFLPTIIANPGQVYSLLTGASGQVYETTYLPVPYIARLPEFISPIFFILGSSMSPGIIIFFIAFGILYLSKRYKKEMVFAPKKEITVISAYIILFMFMVTVLSINHDIRFMSPAFVMLNVVAGLVFYNVMEILRKKLGFKMDFYYVTAMIAIILSQLLTIVSTSLLMRGLTSSIFNRV